MQVEEYLNDNCLAYHAKVSTFFPWFVSSSFKNCECAVHITHGKLIALKIVKPLPIQIWLTTVYCFLV